MKSLYRNNLCVGCRNNKVSKVIYDNKNGAELMNHALLNYNIILPQNIKIA